MSLESRDAGEVLAKRLITIAGLLFIIVLLAELSSRLLSDLYPLNNESTPLLQSFHLVSYILDWFKPYLLAGLGASIFLMRKAQAYIRDETFDLKYVRQYWIEFWIGIFAGGSAVLVFFVELSATTDGRISLSEAMLGFIFGYASEAFFRWLDVTVELFRPNEKSSDS